MSHDDGKPKTQVSAATPEPFVPTARFDTRDMQDVLSNIRRLVSEEAELGTVQTGVPLEDRVSMKTQDPVQSVTDPLVLSSQHRIEVETSRLEDSEPENVFLNGARRDDEALRALVSEVVREELQGDLGKTLTRNIQKLIRREIATALKMRG